MNALWSLPTISGNAISKSAISNWRARAEIGKESDDQTVEDVMVVESKPQLARQRSNTVPVLRYVQ